VHQKGKKMLLINFAVGGAKMAIWLTRKRKLKGEGEVGPEAEFAYFILINNMDRFIEIWTLNDILCTVDYEWIKSFCNL